MYQGDRAERIRLSRDHLRRRFRRALSSYDRAAVVQRRMAERLAEVLSEAAPCGGRVLEIGAGTGLLTARLAGALRPGLYLACDLVFECRAFLEPLGVHFVVADGADPAWLRGEFDLIVANAVFQWFETPERSLRALAEKLVPSGILAFTAFGSATLREVARVSPPGLLPVEKWRLLRPAGLRELRVESWQETLYFEDPLAILRHIRETGAAGGLPARWSLRELRAWVRDLERRKGPRGYPLTFEPVLVLWQRDA